VPGPETIGADVGRGREQVYEQSLECQLSVNDCWSEPIAVGAMQYSRDDTPSIVFEVGWLPIDTHVLVDESSAFASLKLTGVNSTAELYGDAASPIPAARVQL
jgi:hypothetical protein